MSNSYALLFLFFFLLALVGVAGIGVGVVIGLALGEKRETRPVQGSAQAPVSPEALAPVTASEMVLPAAPPSEAEAPVQMSASMGDAMQQPPAPRRSAPAWTIALAIAVMLFCCCCTLLLAVMASMR